MKAMRFCSRATAIAAILLTSVVSTHGQAPSAAAPAAIKFAAEVPLLDCDGTPCIEARIGENKSLKLAIDTGNSNSLLDKAVATEAGLKSTKPMPPGAPGGMFITTIPAVHLGGVTLREVQSLCMSLSDMIDQKQMPAVSGTLAYTAFKDRVLQLDFVAHMVRVSELLTKPVECLAACDKFSLVTFGKKGPPIVVSQGFAINGKPVAAQVDTMYTGSMLIYTSSIDKLGLSDSAKSEKTENFPFTDGGVDMKSAPAQTESFHGATLGVRAPIVYFPTPDVHEPDGLFDATIGLELFYGSVLTLDFRDMTISVSKP
jgi:hypothetical protein